MKAAPETIDAVAQRARLQLIECEKGLGRMRPEACAARWLVASGQAPGIAGVRDSRCKACVHGQQRHDQLRPSERRAMQARLGKPRIARKTGSTHVLKTRVCAGCGVEFELRGGCDGNKRYHDEACRKEALARQRRRPRRRPHPRVPNGVAVRCPRCDARLAIGAPCTDCAVSNVVDGIQRRVG